LTLAETDSAAPYRINRTEDENDDEDEYELQHAAVASLP
jgi:hypothetical protein